ncbi:MAG: hypothetical protein E6G64_04355 [Actinobacteria bacterium]|nr:MAG: hypothetical protein E6G64_04355 [Actinomycetota bacterium]
MEHPKDVGDRTQLAVMFALREAGLAVLVPFGENTRYDLVIDDGESLARVQCKTGRLYNGALVWSTCSSYAHHPNPKKRKLDYQGEIEYFGVYCRETGIVYLVPIEDVPVKTKASIRLDPARNRQRKLIRQAARYEVGQVSVRAELRASSGAPAPSA